MRQLLRILFLAALTAICSRVLVKGGDSVKYNHIGFRCPVCGEGSGTIDEVGITGKREFVFAWKCQKCNNGVATVVEIEELLKHAPTPEPTDTDKKALAEMGVKWDDDTE